MAAEKGIAGKFLFQCFQRFRGGARGRFLLALGRCEGKARVTFGLFSYEIALVLQLRHVV